MSTDEVQITLFTLGAASLSTLLIVVPALLLAWLLARRDWPGKSLVETVVALPLVLPPVATGLLLLKLIGNNGPVGRLAQSWFGTEIVFTWKAVVIAAGVMSFPLLVRSARVAFSEVDARLEHVATTLGASRARVFFTITLPLAARGIAAGVLLSFARSLGEFGATILVAGNIPGQTSTLALRIYGLVQLGHDSQAFRLIAISVVLAFAAVWISEAFIRRRPSR